MDCIIGVSHRFNSTCVAYDLSKVIDKMKSEGMTEEEAYEFYNYNQLGAWMGDTTPCSIEKNL